MLTIAQIYAVVALLLAFNVPTDKVQNIQTMLENKQPAIQKNADSAIDTVASAAVVTEPLTASYTTLTRSSNGTYQPSSDNVLNVGEMAYFDVHASDASIASENLTYTWTTDNKKYNDSGVWNKDGALQFAYMPEKVGTTTLTFTISNGKETKELPINVIVK